MSQESTFLGTDSIPAIPPTSDEKTLGLLAHILTFVAPFLAPLIIYLIKKDESSFVAWHAKESLNFQITILNCCHYLFHQFNRRFIVMAAGNLLAYPDHYCNHPCK